MVKHGHHHTCPKCQRKAQMTSPAAIHQVPPFPTLKSLILPQDNIPIGGLNPGLARQSPGIPVAKGRSKSSLRSSSFSLSKSQLTMRSFVAQSMEEQPLSPETCNVIFDRGLGGQDERGDYIVSYNEDGESFSVTETGRYCLTFQGTIKVKQDCHLQLEFECGALPEQRLFYRREYYLKAGEERDLNNISHVPMYAGNDLRVTLSGAIGILSSGSRLIIEKSL